MKTYFFALATAALVSTGAYARGDNPSTQRYLDARVHALSLEKSRAEGLDRPASTEPKSRMGITGGVGSNSPGTTSTIEHYEHS